MDSEEIRDAVIDDVVEQLRDAADALENGNAFVESYGYSKGIENIINYDLTYVDSDGVERTITVD